MWYRSGAGFVVTNEGGTIRECAAFGDIASEGSDVNYIWRSGIAGFCYRNWGSGRIESCYCTGALRDISDSTNVVAILLSLRSVMITDMTQYISMME